ncbi:hypothetical protein [Phyllobacterium meliloti]
MTKTISTIIGGALLLTSVATAAQAGALSAVVTTGISSSVKSVLRLKVA